MCGRMDGFAVVDRAGEADSFLGEECRHVLERVGGVNDEHDYIVGVGFLEAFEDRKLLDARAAVGCPHVEDDYFAASVGQVELGSVKFVGCEVCQLVADRGADRGIACVSVSGSGSSLAGLGSFGCLGAFSLSFASSLSAFRSLGIVTNLRIVTGLSTFTSLSAGICRLRSYACGLRLRKVRIQHVEPQQGKT